MALRVETSVQFFRKHTALPIIGSVAASLVANGPALASRLRALSNEAASRRTAQLRARAERDVLIAELSGEGSGPREVV